MERHLIAACAAALIGAGIAGCSSMGSVGAASAFKQLGGMQNVSSIANGFVGSALKDPKLAGLTTGKSVDPTATTDKVSSQLCAMLGGGCKAPLSESQVASAASKVTPEQSSAISEHFNSALSSVESNSKIRDIVTASVGDKLPGVLAGMF
jgi:truncated hemoglobin YjbI